MNDVFNEATKLHPHSCDIYFYNHETKNILHEKIKYYIKRIAAV
jgi:hypothetical protein